MRNALTATASKGEWCWELKNLANISTVTREWLAIHAFSSLPYASVVLSGTPASAGRRRRLTRGRCPSVYGAPSNARE